MPFSFSYLCLIFFLKVKNTQESLDMNTTSRINGREKVERKHEILTPIYNDGCQAMEKQVNF